MSACAVCERNQGDLGEPSLARWVGPDGDELCSIHFVSKYGHGQALVRVEDYVAPKKVKAPARRKKETANG
jgi:hypothetical protein